MYISFNFIKNIYILNFHSLKDEIGLYNTYQLHPYSLIFLQQHLNKHKTIIYVCKIKKSLE